MGEIRKLFLLVVAGIAVFFGFGPQKITAQDWKRVWKPVPGESSNLKSHPLNSAEEDSSSDQISVDYEEPRSHGSPQEKGVKLGNASSQGKKDFDADSERRPPILEQVDLAYNSEQIPSLRRMPRFSSQYRSKFIARTQRQEYVMFTVDPDLQQFAQHLLDRSPVQNIAAVVMEPQSGKILAMVQKSESVDNFALYGGLPAASLFKIVTATAAFEQGAITPDTRINFRGGNYTLNEWNYIPNPRTDRKSMSVTEAMAKSCNPVFGRIGYKYLNRSLLSDYSEAFNFNSILPFDLPLQVSRASIPEDQYELSRTSAGFGEVTLSPVHAATIMASIARGGLMIKPTLIDRIVNSAGQVTYQAAPQGLRRVMPQKTARLLMHSMSKTTSIGTSKREFASRSPAVLPGIGIAAKTGTLRGENPEGITNWFIAAAPLDNPKVALAVAVVNAGGPSSKASHFGRSLLQKFFGEKISPDIVLRYKSGRHTKKSNHKPKKVSFLKKTKHKSHGRA